MVQERFPVLILESLGQKMRSPGEHGLGGVEELVCAPRLLSLDHTYVGGRSGQR